MFHVSTEPASACTPVAWLEHSGSRWGAGAAGCASRPSGDPSCLAKAVAALSGDRAPRSGGAPALRGALQGRAGRGGGAWSRGCGVLLAWRTMRSAALVILAGAPCLSRILSKRAFAYRRSAAFGRATLQRRSNCPTKFTNSRTYTLRGGDSAGSGAPSATCVAPARRGAAGGPRDRGVVGPGHPTRRSRRIASGGA